jgi:hypothetical protein
VASIRWSFLLEGLAFATGAPPSVWRAVPAKPKVKVEHVKTKRCIQYLALPFLRRPGPENHGE